MSSSLTSPTKHNAGSQLGLPNIAFIGKAGAGKSTAAHALMRNEGSGYHLLSFAAPLKEIAATIWGDAAYNDRGKLQQLGTAVRNIDEDAWCNLWRKLAESLGGPLVTDDMRFPNELCAASAHGFVIVRILASREQRIARLTAMGKLQSEDQLEHPSETALDHIAADYTLDGSGSAVDLAEQVFDIVDREARKR